MGNLIRVELDENSKEKIEAIKKATQKIEKLVTESSNSIYESDRLLRIDEVENMVSFTRKWIYAKMKEDLFPKPIKLINASRWKLSDIQNWIESQKYM